MKFLKKVWILVTSLLGGISATTESPGTPVGKTESLLGQAFAEGYRQDALKAEKKLDAASDALRQIECLTNAPDMFLYEMIEAVQKVHEISQNAWRETQK